MRISVVFAVTSVNDVEHEVGGVKIVVTDVIV